MNPDDLLNLWSNLERQSVPADAGPYLHLQLSGGEVPIAAILRVDDRRPGLLVRFPARDSHRIPKADSGRGYSFERTVPVGGDTFGLPILVADMEARGVFSAMAADLVSAVEQARGRDPAVDVVLQRIALWRRFLQRRVALLSDEEVRGLAGELEVLSRIAAVEDVDRALDAWRGPFGDLHDFAFTDGPIEVKTCQADSGARVHISESGQIAVDASRPMWLAVVRLTVGGNAGITLPETVAAIVGRMSGMQQQRFRELLATYGYMESHARDYPDRILAHGPETFEVREGFPHVQAAHIPGGVVALRYALELAALAPFRRPNLHVMTA